VPVPLLTRSQDTRAHASRAPPAGAARLSSSSIIAAALSLPLGNARAASAGERSNSLSHACAARTHVVSAESGAAGGDVDCSTGAWPVWWVAACAAARRQQWHQRMRAICPSRARGRSRGRCAVEGFRSIPFLPAHGRHALRRGLLLPSELPCRPPGSIGLDRMGNNARPSKQLAIDAMQ
jgi:hypothetical protein